MMKTCLIATILWFFSFQAGAQEFTDYPMTGLDACVDFIASQSETMKGEINIDAADGWTFVYSQGWASMTDFANMIAYIARYDCNGPKENKDRYLSIGLLG